MRAGPVLGAEHTEVSERGLGERDKQREKTSAVFWCNEVGAWCLELW